MFQSGSPLAASGAAYSRSGRHGQKLPATSMQNIVGQWFSSEFDFTSDGKHVGLEVELLERHDVRGE